MYFLLKRTVPKNAIYIYLGFSIFRHRCLSQCLLSFYVLLASCSQTISPIDNDNILTNAIDNDNILTDAIDNDNILTDTIAE